MRNLLKIVLSSKCGTLISKLNNINTPLAFTISFKKRTIDRVALQHS